MHEDDVLRAVRAAREAFARSHGYNIRAMVADLREHDARGDRPVVRLPSRRPPVPAATPPSPSPAPQKTRQDATVPEGP